MSTSGHLFVVQADMTRLAADAFLIPCDSFGQVSGTWRPFIEPGAEAQEAGDWFIPEVAEWNDAGFGVLPDRTLPGTTGPDSVWGKRMLVDTVGVDSIEAMVRRAADAVRAAADGLTKGGGRSVPLVALPVLGVGQGNFRGRRAEVVTELVRQLNEFVRSAPIDVVLVARNRADFAAAQWARGLVAAEPNRYWSALQEEEMQLADELGEKAAGGELSLFVGAGASMPLGFPGWDALLTELADESNAKPRPEGMSHPEYAESLQIPDLEHRIAERFQTQKHALGHALLVDLRTRAMVTTNYDPCLENAAEIVRGKTGLNVLARQLALGSRPWLLKVHGDLNKPETIVLRESQYNKLQTEWHALRGVVQSLMLTSHLLFVGFGFADVDFLDMAEAVQKVRALASGDPQPVGTAVRLQSSQPHDDKYQELRYLTIPGDDRRQAARNLEIWLDRLAWRSQVNGNERALFLLDPDYLQGADRADLPLIDALNELARTRPEWVGSAGSTSVDKLLADLGYRA